MENYDLGQVIGEGGFAVVYKAVDRLHQREVAVKCIDKGKLRVNNLLHRIENEIRIHNSLHHPNIASAFRSLEDENYYYIVMELCETGNLFRYLRRRQRLDEIEAVFIIRQIMSAIGYLHSNGLVHRDLKLSNVLIHDVFHPHLLDVYSPSSSKRTSLANSDNEIPGADSNAELLTVKLCDFGLAIQLQHPDEEHYTLCGTPNYIAPEIVNNEAHGYPADIWSIGALYYSLVMGEPLFEQEEARQWISGDTATRKSALQRIFQTIQGAPEDILSEQSKDFLLQLFQTDPTRRPSVDKMFQYPLLTKYSQVFDRFRSSRLRLSDTGLRTNSLIDATSVRTEQSPFHGSSLVHDGSTEDFPTQRRIAAATVAAQFSNLSLSTETDSNDHPVTVPPHTQRSDLLPPRREESPMLDSLIKLHSRQWSPSQSHVPNPAASLLSRSEGSLLSRSGQWKSPLAQSQNSLMSIQRRSSGSGGLWQHMSLISQNVEEGLSNWARAVQDMSLASSISSVKQPSSSTWVVSSAARAKLPTTSSSLTGATSTVSAMSAGAVFAHLMEQLPYLSPFFLFTRQGDLLLYTKEGHLVYTSCDVDAANRNLAQQQPPSPSSIRLVLSTDGLWLGAVTQEMVNKIANKVNESLERDTTVQDAASSSTIELQESQRRIQATKTKSMTSITFIHDRGLSTKDYPVADPTTCKKELKCSILNADSKQSEILATLLRRMNRLLKGVQSQLPKAILYTSSSRMRPQSTLLRHRSGRQRHNRYHSVHSSESVKQPPLKGGDVSQMDGEMSTISIPPPPPPPPPPPSEDNSAGLDMKCMLMSNTPLPDFHAQWQDGTRLVYRLDNGKVLIDHPAQAQEAAMEQPGIRWEGELFLLPSSTETPIACSNGVLAVPPALQSYLLASQTALMRCLEEVRNVESLSSSTRVEGHVSRLSSGVAQSKTMLLSRNNHNANRRSMLYPIVIVDK